MIGPSILAGGGGGGAPIWPGKDSVPGSKASFGWLVNSSNGLDSGKTILDVTMPITALRRILYTNANGNFPSPPAAPIGVQIDKGPPEVIAGCGLPLHVTGGGDGFLVISLTSPNVNGGLFAIDPSQPNLSVNLEAGGTGSSSPFFGGSVGVEASVQLNFTGQPADGPLFTITAPAALGGGARTFYLNNGHTYTPGPGEINLSPSLEEQVLAVDLPVDWTVTVVPGMPGTTTIGAQVHVTGDDYNAGVVATNYPGATINGAGSPGAFAGGVNDTPAIPPRAYPAGTSDQFAASASGASSPHTAKVAIGVDSGPLRRVNAGATDGSDQIVAGQLQSTDIADFVTAAGAVASNERAKMETVDEIISCDGSAKALDPALRTSRLSITANGSALSLGDGARVGQRKTIIVIANMNPSDTATLTPAHADGWTSLPFTAAGYVSWAVLEWQARGWTFCEHANVTPF